jgi:hypothetical protein
MRTYSAATLVLTVLLVGNIAVDVAIASGPLPLSGTISGTFTDPQPNDTTYTGVGTNSFTYGEPAFGNPNQLTMDGDSISTLTGSDFALGRLSYFNGSTYDGTHSDSVELNLDIILSAPVPTSITLPVTLDLLSTENSTGAADPDADYVSAVLTSLPLFVANGTTYQLQLVGFGNLSGADTLFDPHTVKLGEQDSMSADLVGVIAPAPEPSSCLLLLSAAFSFYCLLRRRFI